MVGAFYFWGVYMAGFDMSIPAGNFIETEHEARQWMQYFLETHKQNGGLGIDSETTGLARHKDVVIVWSLSNGRERICLPSRFIALYKDAILENPEINLDGTNIGFDAHMFANSGADISKAGQWRDTSLQSWLLNENNVGRHGLKECVVDHFGRVTPHFNEIFGKIPPKRKDGLNLTVGDLIRAAMDDPERRIAAADYASLDAYNSTLLRSRFDTLLAKVDLGMGNGATLFDHFYNVETRFAKVLWKMERRGICVDGGFLVEKQGPMQEELLRIEKEFAKEAGQPINLRSPKQLQWFFFDVLKKTPLKMTKGGTTGIKAPSTDNEVLETWAGQGDKFAKLCLRHRQLAKIHDTYVSGLQEYLDPNSRIHTTLNQHGTVTGRLSSTDPNLQNIPRASEDDFKIREAFVPGSQMCFIVADYEQLEMRLMAHFSRDQKMINAIKNGMDLHCLTVSEMYGTPYDTVIAAKDADKAVKKGKRAEPLTREEEDLLFKRQGCKAAGFGIIYGIGGAKLANNLTKMGTRIVPEEEGYQLIDKWFNVFPEAHDYIESTRQGLWNRGAVQTILGRFRRFGDLKGMSKKDSAQCERQGVNSIIQGTASDIAKMAMIRADEDPELAKLGARMLLQVHDEIVWECPDSPEVIAAVKKRAKEIMEDPFGQPLLVPIPVEVGHGYSWASAK